MIGIINVFIFKKSDIKTIVFTCIANDKDNPTVPGSMVFLCTTQNIAANNTMVSPSNSAHIPIHLVKCEHKIK